MELERYIKQLDIIRPTTLEQSRHLSYNKAMFIVGILSWWYGNGLLDRLRAVKERILSTIDYFSIDLLAKTIFSPFRQISAGKVDGSIGQKWHAFVDRIFSRIIGTIVRSMLIIIGTIGIILTIVLGILLVASWLMVPALPFIGIILTLIGWTPSWM